MVLYYSKDFEPEIGRKSVILATVCFIFRPNSFGVPGSAGGSHLGVLLQNDLMIDCWFIG
jgi:hypothetical protein